MYDTGVDPALKCDSVPNNYVDMMVHVGGPGGMTPPPSGKFWFLTPKKANMMQSRSKLTLWCIDKKIWEKRIPMIVCGVQHSAIIAHFLMPETQQSTMVIIFIIYSSYVLKDLVEL